MFFDYFGYTTHSTDSMADLASPSSITNSVTAANGSTPSLTPGSGHIETIPTEHLEGAAVTPIVHNRSSTTNSTSDISLGQSNSNNDRNSTNNSNISCATSTSNTGFIHSLHHTPATPHGHSVMHSESHLGSSIMPTLSPQRINLNSGFGTTMPAIYPSMHHTAMSMSDTYR